MAKQAGAAAHWDAAYGQGDDTRSWFENYPGMSLRMLDRATASPVDGLIDVGGGASPLAGVLLDRGFGDLTVLDISAAGMQYARDRLGARADQVSWLAADVLDWHPQRRYRAWHDRAVFHFLTSDEHRQQYLPSAWMGRRPRPRRFVASGRCFTTSWAMRPSWRSFRQIRSTG
jgi:trans-aconitate methyltransferase